MRAKLTFRNIVVAAVIALFVIQLASLGLYVRVNYNLKRQIGDNQLSTQLIYNEMDGASQALSLSVLPQTNRLYLPELNLTVPLNPLTRSLRYDPSQGLRGDGSGDIRITSADMTDHQMRVQSCGDMVRLKIEAKPNAYSPSQPLYATTTLNDGRKLQIYASSLKECQTAWQIVSPQKIAEEFKNAQSY